MEIEIPQNSGSVGLRIQRPERGPSGELDYFTVELADPSLRATARVYALMAAGLPALFEQMAREWRGWDDALEWESLEEELHLSCTTDSCGHVALEIALRPSSHLACGVCTPQPAPRPASWTRWRALRAGSSTGTWRRPDGRRGHVPS